MAVESAEYIHFIVFGLCFGVGFAIGFSIVQVIQWMLRK